MAGSHDELLNAFLGPLHRYVGMRVPEQDCDDVVGDIFVKALQKADQRRGDKAPWLFAIARNQVIDYYRRRSKRMSVEQTAEVEVAAALAPLDLDALAKLEQREFRQRLRQCLAQLSEQEQDVIALKFTDGLTNVEIAELLGIKPGTLGVLLHRAMRRLRDLLTRTSAASPPASQPRPAEA